MASLLTLPNSPFWYLSYKDAKGRWQKKSTGLRKDDPNETAEARIVRAKAEAKELRTAQSKAATAAQGAWDTWVGDFLDRHCANPQTRKRYEGAWKWIVLWMQHREIHTPADVTYRLALDFLKWRTEFVKRTGRSVGKNTARNDLKVLAIVMKEAVRLEFITASPLASLGIKRERPKQKPELSDDDIGRLREALTGEPEWMGIAFDIALYTGCRLRETRIPLASVDLEAGGGVGKITFPSPKGGEARAFTIPMPPELRPLFTRQKAERRKFTLDLPFQPSRRWGQFLEVHDLSKEWVFHCLRVTYINRLRRGGVPREVARRLVNHSSDLVHQIYQREEFEDLVKYAGAVKYPTAGDERAPSPTTPPAP